MVEIGAIHLYPRARISEQDLCGRFHDPRLARTCRTEEQEVPDRAPRRVQTGAEYLVQVDQGLHSLFLPHDLRTQRRLELERVRAALVWIEWKYVVFHGRLLAPPQLRRSGTKSPASLVKLTQLDLNRGLQKPQLH